jgi:hypothetical protein
MKRQIRWLVLPFAATLAFSSWAVAKHLITLDQVPERARATIGTAVGNGTIDTVQVEEVVYAVNYRTGGGTRFRLRVSENGELISNLQQ